MFDPGNAFVWTMVIIAGILLLGVALLGLILGLARYVRRDDSRPAE